MALKPNIKIFLIFILSSLLLQSCERNKNDVIPDVYIDFYISLNDPQFFDLTAPLTFAYVDANTNNIGLPSAGYDGNGIIIFRAQENEFFAYDRTCPHDYVTDGVSVKVNVTDGIYAVCPRCSTKYALPNFGTPLSGYAGRYPLKNYKTSFDGMNLHVWNK